MGVNKRVLRTLFQSMAIALVAWGIYHSVTKATQQLAAQRTSLAQQSAERLTAAKASSDPQEADRLRDEAAALEHQVRNFWKADPLTLCLAGLCYAAGMVPASIYWRRCLFALGQTAPTPAIIWAYFYGNLGKYFPGKAMVIVLRLAALAPYGVKRIATSLTIFIETLTMMAVGGAVAAIALILLNLDWRLTALAIALLCTTFLPTWPPLLRQILPRLQKGVAPETVAEWTARINWRLITHGWLTLSLTWIGFGLSLMFVLHSSSVADFGSASTTRIMLSAFGACALAVVLGFVSLIPGGAGVREVVLSTVLTPVVGPTAALCAAVWLRIVWLATELVMVGLTGLFHAQSLKRIQLTPPSNPTKTQSQTCTTHRTECRTIVPNCSVPCDDL